MRRIKKESETTSDSRVYRITTIISQLHCSFCAANRGCNRADRWGHKWNGGWKNQKIRKQWQRNDN